MTTDMSSELSWLPVGEHIFIGKLLSQVQIGRAIGAIGAINVYRKLSELSDYRTIGQSDSVLTENKPPKGGETDNHHA